MDESVERSAGGVVFDPDGNVLLILDRYGRWAFPKGHVEGGESDVQAAKREVREETGIEAEIVTDLVTLRYKLANGVMKESHLFVMTASATAITPLGAEIREARFRPVEDALEILRSGSYSGYDAILEKAVGALANGR